MGASGEIKDRSKLRFINKYEYASYSAMMDAIAGRMNTTRDRIGVRAAKSELLKDNEKPGDEKFLELDEVNINGSKVLAAIHSYAVLVGLVVNGEKELPPGVIDDLKGSGRFKFRPIMPIGIEKEIASYKNAVLLLSSAA